MRYRHSIIDLTRVIAIEKEMKPFYKETKLDFFIKKYGSMIEAEKKFSLLRKELRDLSKKRGYL